MPTEIRPIAVIWSIRLVRFWAERKRSFSNWKIAQISARPMTTRSEARSPWMKRRMVARRASPALVASVAAAASLIPRRPSSRRVLVLVVVLADPGDRRDDVLLGRLFGLEVPGRPAEAEDEDAVGDLEDVDQVVADHDHAEAALAEFADQVEDLGRLGDAERRRRLVEQDDLRLAEQGAGDRDLLALPAGERPDLAAQAGDRHRQVREQLARLVLHARLVELSARHARARAKSPRARGRGWRRRRGCRRAPGPGRRSRSPGRRRPGASRSRPARRRSGSSRSRRRGSRRSSSPSSTCRRRCRRRGRRLRPRGRRNRPGPEPGPGRISCSRRRARGAERRRPSQISPRCPLLCMPGL